MADVLSELSAAQHDANVPSSGVCIKCSFIKERALWQYEYCCKSPASSTFCAGSPLVLSEIG